MDQEIGPAEWTEVAMEEVCPSSSMVRVALTQPTSWQKAHRYNDQCFQKCLATVTMLTLSSLCGRMDGSRLPDVLESGAAKEALYFWRRAAMEMGDNGWQPLRSRCEWYWLPYTATAAGVCTDQNSGLQLTPAQSPGPAWRIIVSGRQVEIMLAWSG